MLALEDRDNFSLQSKGQICLLSTLTKKMFPSRAKVRQAYCPYKRFGSPSSDSVSVMQLTAYARVVVRPPLCHPMGNGAWGPGPNDDTLAAAIAVSNIDLSLVLWVSASMKLYQVNLLSCK